jgi:hypothetical protein
MSVYYASGLYLPKKPKRINHFENPAADTKIILK